MAARDRVVSTRSTIGVGDIAPISFFTVLARYPPVLSITLRPRSHGVTLKATFVNIRDTNEFVVNITAIGQADAVNDSAYEFGSDVEAFEELLGGSSTASSRCRRCPATWFVDVSSASRLRAGRLRTARAEYTFVDTSSPPRSP